MKKMILSLRLWVVLGLFLETRNEIFLFMFSDLPQRDDLHTAMFSDDVGEVNCAHLQIMITFSEDIKFTL